MPEPETGHSGMAITKPTCQAAPVEGARDPVPNEQKSTISGTSRQKAKLKVSYSISPYFDEPEDCTPSTELRSGTEEPSDILLLGTSSDNSVDRSATLISNTGKTFDPGGIAVQSPRDENRQCTERQQENTTTPNPGERLFYLMGSSDTSANPTHPLGNYIVPTGLPLPKDSTDGDCKSKDCGVARPNSDSSSSQILHRTCTRSIRSVVGALTRPFSFHGITPDNMSRMHGSNNKPQPVRRRSWSEQLLVTNEVDYLLLMLQQDAAQDGPVLRAASARNIPATFDPQTAMGTPPGDKNDILNATTIVDGRCIIRGGSSNVLTPSDHQRVHKKRVRFDPLAVLWDASLKGDLEAVVETAHQVSSISKPNDDGTTALHYAVCAGNSHIVKFLLKAGADVNARDSDGWTPLHYAASMNNLTIAKCLVEHGACIYAITVSDHETPGEKCEEAEQGYHACTNYLSGIQQCIGVANGGFVFAAYDYNATQWDELSFSEGDRLVIMERDNSQERGWWRARRISNGETGYVPRSYLAFHQQVSRNDTSRPNHSTNPYSLFRINSNNFIESIGGDNKWNFLKEATVLPNKHDMLTSLLFNESMAIAV